MQSKIEASQLLEAIEQPVIVLDADHNIVGANRTAVMLSGKSEADVIGSKCYEIFHGKEEPVEDCPMEVLLRSGSSATAEVAIGAEDAPYLVSCSTARTNGQGIEEIVHVGVDMSEMKRRRSEQIMHHEAQHRDRRLRSVRTMSAGIAHQFNNILMIIMGNTEHALMTLPENSPIRSCIETIREQTNRAAELCTYLTFFAGEGKGPVSLLDLSGLVEEMKQAFNVVTAKNITVEYDLCCELPPIQVDRSQLRQIVLDRVSHASEDLGGNPGKIRIATGVIDCDDMYWRDRKFEHEFQPGRHVFLSVTNSEARSSVDGEELVDPFTTGSVVEHGLGIASVVGMIHGNEGTATAYHEHGKEAAFRILFPVAANAASHAKSPSVSSKWKGSGTVLLVDDEADVRYVVRLMLRKLGFEVVMAANGQEALDMFRDNGERFRLVILDNRMPGRRGREVFKEMRRIRSDVTAILCSGFISEEDAEEIEEEGFAGYIRKPFISRVLRETVQSVLEPVPA